MLLSWLKQHGKTGYTATFQGKTYVITPYGKDKWLVLCDGVPVDAGKTLKDAKARAETYATLPDEAIDKVLKALRDEPSDN